MIICDIISCITLIECGKGVVTMATIKDVALKAGVSIASVSRVMNQRGYLSDEIKNSVHQAMKDLNYYPNDLARSLYSQRSNILGVIVPSLAHPFFGEIVTYIEYFAHQKGYKILVCNSLENKKKETEYVTMLKRSQVDGIIIGSHTQSLDDYRNINLPLISLDRQLSDNIPYVCCDNYNGGEIATRHLIECGCKKLLHISGNLSVDMLSNRRTNAFIDTCEKYKVVYKVCELADYAIVDFKNDRDLSVIIQQNPDYDGLFATSDISAAIAIRILNSLGRRVPDDVKVVGFDGIATSVLMNPQITTIQQPIEAICQYAVDLLEKMILGETVPNQMTLPVNLIKRDST